MHRSLFAGRFVFPAFSLLLLVAPARAQKVISADQPLDAALSNQPYAADFSSSAQTQSAVPAAGADAQSTQDTSQNPPPAPTEEQRAQLARQAQERVRSRRAQRIAAAVQDTYGHKYEIYGGVAFLRLRPGTSLENLSETGFDAGITRYFTSKVGITADGRGYYGNAYVGNLAPYTGQTSPCGGAGQPTCVPGLPIFEPSISNYSFSAGPQYRFYMHQKWGISGIALVGVTRNIFYANSQGTPGTLVNLYPDAWRLTATIGIPIDYNLGPGLSVRITPNYYLTNWGSEIQNNRGFTAGVNYRFGRR